MVVDDKKESYQFKELIKGILLSEIFLYLLMGFLTTVVNLVSYKVLLDALNANGSSNSINWKVAEIIAFIIAVIFAFITNKLFVFKSLSLSPVKVFSEFGMFLGGRIVTELINFLIMLVMIDKMQIDEFITKILASVVVIVLNYIFSKFIIFKKKKNSSE